MACKVWSHFAPGRVGLTLKVRIIAHCGSAGHLAKLRPWLIAVDGIGRRG